MPYATWHEQGAEHKRLERESGFPQPMAPIAEARLFDELIEQEDLAKVHSPFFPSVSPSVLAPCRVHTVSRCRKERHCPEIKGKDASLPAPVDAPFGIRDPPKGVDQLFASWPVRMERMTEAERTSPWCCRECVKLQAWKILWQVPMCTAGRPGRAEAFGTPGHKAQAERPWQG